jgi:tetratricopeptide (TPR) repeat protein
MNGILRGLKWMAIGAALVAGLNCSSNQQSANSPWGDPSKLKPQNNFESKKEDPPVNARTRYAAGRFAESQGDLKKAIDQYWDAIKLDPNNLQAMFRLGVVYSELKHYPEATLAWKLYLKADHHSATACNNLAFCYEMAGRNADAEQMYLEGLKREPANAACHVNYGLLLARLERVSDAVLQLQQVLTPAQVHYDIASVFEQEGRKQEAKLEYQKAITMDPRLSQAVVRLETLK